MHRWYVVSGRRQYDRRAMRGHEYIRYDDKAASRLAPEGDDGRFDFSVTTNGCNDRHDLERQGRRLKCGHISRCGSGVRIEHDCGPFWAGGGLREQLKPLASQRGFEVGEAGDVPTRTVKPRDDAAGDWVAHACKDDRDRPRLPLDGKSRRGRTCQNDVGFQVNQLLRDRSYPIDVTAAPTKVHPHVAAIGPTQVRKRLRERRDAKLHRRIVFVERHEHTDAPHPLRLLRLRSERPRCRATEQRDELAPFHSITSSARARSRGGTSRPSALAVVRL